MEPKIENTSFGTITIDGQIYRHDINIRLDGEIKKRKKKLSKQVYGTSHTISLDEAHQIYEKGAETLVIGTGQYGLVNLSDEAQQFFEDQNLHVIMEPTPKAIVLWNEIKGNKIGLYHTTC